VWDDAVVHIAEFRAIHSVPVETAGLGPHPTDQGAATEWRQLMLRVLEDRLWLAAHDRPEPTPVAPLTPRQLVDRQEELEQLLARSPADQRGFIDRIVTSQLDPTEMHEYLTSAMAVQDARREWILTNWPYLVEMEQITALIAQQAPLAHWPAAQPPEVLVVLDQLRSLAPELNAREQRTLAQLDEAEAQADPVRQLEARRDHLQQLVAAATPVEVEAVRDELIGVTTELRDARRAQRVESSFERYSGTTWDAARTTRVATLAHEVLSTQPSWVVDNLRRQHERGQLTTSDIHSLAEELVAKAVTADRGGAEPTALEPPTTEPALFLGIGQ
jgi:hypothetical protein